MTIAKDDDLAFDSSLISDELQAFLWSEKGHGGGMTVRSGRIGGDHARADALGEPETGFRRDDVGIAHSLVFEITPRVTRGGDGLIHERDGLEILQIVSKLEGFDPDFPARLVRRSLAHDDVAARCDEDAGKTAFLEDAEGRIGRISLRDATDVEEHALDLLRDGAFVRIEDEMEESRARFGGGDLCGGGKGVVLAAHAPEPDEVTRGDVEGSVGRGGHFSGRFKEGEEFFADGDGFARRGFGEGVDLRLGTVVRK